MEDALARRRAGVLLHPTSLPGSGSRGTLGAEARRFVDFLCTGGFSVWQTLPLGPTDAYGSPYCLRSAYAGNIDLIDARELEDTEDLPAGFATAAGRSSLEAYRAFARSASALQKRRFASFVSRHRRWLFPYGLFELFRRRFGPAWWRWPGPYRDRSREILNGSIRRFRPEFRSIVLAQYLFDLQWSAIKRYANDRGVYLFGDLPFYVDRDSVEVWWNPELFRLDAAGEPEAVSGVPPDYFSSDGQLWGNPLYRPEQIAENGFAWWIERFRAQFHRFDLVRIDHFRALDAYWEVPAGAATARDGRWLPGFGAPLLEELRRHLGGLALVAEDLGVITDEVRRLRDRFGLPGMVVLQFAFDGSSDNPHLPANHSERAVVYTGTHDNDTTVGWYRRLEPATRDYVRRVLGCDDSGVPAAMIDAAYASPARLAVLPLQDLLGVGSEGRMNTPGTAEGNWRWRFDPGDLTPELASLARERARRHSRVADSSKRR